MASKDPPAEWKELPDEEKLRRMITSGKSVPSKPNQELPNEERRTMIVFGKPTAGKDWPADERELPNEERLRRMIRSGKSIPSKSNDD